MPVIIAPPIPIAVKKVEPQPNEEIRQVFEIASQVNKASYGKTVQPQVAKEKITEDYNCDMNREKAPFIDTQRKFSGLPLYVEEGAEEFHAISDKWTIAASEFAKLLLNLATNVFPKVLPNNLMLFLGASKNITMAFNVLNSFENIDKSKLKKFFEPFKIPTNRIFTELQQKYTWFHLFAHELAHNVHTLHNIAFWELHRELLTAHIEKLLK